MNNQSSENYLDQLLNAVNVEVPKSAANVEKREPVISTDNTEEKTYESMLEDFVSDSESEGPKMAFSDMNLYESPMARSEEDFVREFEAELEDNENEDLLENYEAKMGIDQSETPDLDGYYKGEDVEPDSEFYRGFEDMEQQIEENPAEEPFEMTESVDDILEKVAADISGESIEATEEIFVEDLLAGNYEEEALASDNLVEEESEGTSGAELNLAEMGEEDLLSLLAGSDEFADLGDMLAGSENGEISDDEDVFSAFADSELEKQISEQEETEDENVNDGNGGFFAALFARFFGKKKNDSVKLSSGKGVSAEQLADENEKILAELDDVDSDGFGSRGKKKIKKEKPKKEKAAKPKKEKKPKAPKPKKPKKEKKPKEVDNTPPLPKKPVFLIWLAAISLFVLVIVGTNLSSYSTAITEAKSLFDGGYYAKAYTKLSGLTIKDKDLELYNRLAVLAPADAEYGHYEVFLKNNEPVRALDSLICAAGRCEINMKSAETYGCLNYLETLQLKVENELREQYGMTYEDAVAMYELYDRDDYTDALYEKVKELGLQ